MILLSACGGSAQAETMTFKCTETVGGNQSEFTMVYEGTDEGILGVKTASGETMAVMPDKAAIEECVKGKAPPEQLATRTSCSAWPCLAPLPCRSALSL